MRNSRSNRQKKTGIITKKYNSRRRFLKFLFIAFVFYLFYNFGQGFFKAYHLKKNSITLQKELQVLQQENLELQKNFEYMQSKEAVEKIAREKLGLIKPGEMIILKAEEAVE